MESVILFYALAPWGAAPSDAFARLGANVRLDDCGAAFKELRRLLTTAEIIPWPLPAATVAELSAHEAFSLNLLAMGGPSASKFENVRSRAVAEPVVANIRKTYRAAQSACCSARLLSCLPLAPRKCRGPRRADTRGAAQRTRCD